MGRFSRTHLREGGTRPLELIIDESIMLFETGNHRILRVSQNKSPITQRGYEGRRPSEIRRGLWLSQTHVLSIPRLAKHALRNAKRALIVENIGKKNPGGKSSESEAYC